jgi:hypothetical protein
MPTIFHPTELTDEHGFVTDAELRISFDYTPYEAPTRDCPGSPEEIDVHAASVWCCGQRLGDHTAPLKTWEPIVWAYIVAERAEAALSAAGL